MKKIPLLSMLCSAALFTLPAYADVAPAHAATPAATTAPKRAPAAPPVSKEAAAATLERNKLMRNFGAWRVYEPISRELLFPFSLAPVSKGSLKKLTDFQFSPQAQATFQELFGTPRPLHMNWRESDQGEIEINYLLQALDYTDPATGSVAKWDILRGTQTYSKDLRRMRAIFDWPMFSQSFGKDMQLRLRQIHLTQEVGFNAHQLPLGVMQLEIPEATLNVGSKEQSITLNHVRMTGGMTQREKLLEAEADISTTDAMVMGQEFGPFHMSYRVTGLNEAATARLFHRVKQLKMNGDDMTDRLLLSNAILNKDAWQVLTPVSKFELQDLSIVYQSMKAVISGAVWLDKAKATDMLNPKSLKEKLSSHFELTMPRALALKLASLAAPKVADGKAGASNPEQQAAALLQSWISKGMIKEEGDQLHAVFDYAGGISQINGHPLDGALKANAGAAAKPVRP